MNERKISIRDTGFPVANRLGRWIAWSGPVSFELGAVSFSSLYNSHTSGKKIFFFCFGPLEAPKIKKKKKNQGYSQI